MRIRDRRDPRDALGLLLLILLAGWVATAHPDSEAVADASDPACIRSGEAAVTLPQPFPGDTLALPHRLLQADAFVLQQGERMLRRGADFHLLAREGRLVWRGSAPPREPPLVARYRYLPVDLAGRWAPALVPARADTVRVAAAPGKAQRRLPPGAHLEIGGSKSFSIEFGNRRDLSLEQSLDLTIRGQLAERVAVRAVLTDRRTPLQPEGTTAELSDLDQVLVEVDSPWGDLHLGDLTAEQDSFVFLAHRREMEGLLARGHLAQRHRAHAAVGRGLGDHRSLQRFGEEGRQGPYDLLERQTGEQSVIVAGSERVWLDGVRMQRGTENDYTIDYASGELWFTVRRPISAVSEIRVDYQVRQGAFEREYYSFGAGSRGEAGGLAVAWFRERDNPDNSPLLSLDDEERAALAAAGDSVTAALAGGVVEVPAGEGDYAAVEVDSLAAPFFLYVGPADPGDPAQAGGDYEVTFVDVGPGRGDYADSVSASGETIYYFVGRRQGRHLPGRSLPLPRSLDLVAVRGGGVLAAGLEIEAEGALSWNDRNVLSPIDDRDNAGAALRLGGGWRLGRLLGGRPELLRLQFQWRNVEQRFVSPERLDETFAYRRWNASSAQVLEGRDRRGKIGVALHPSSSLQMAADWERLHAPGRFRGERWHARVARRGRLSAEAEIWRSRAREAGVLRRGGQQQAALRWRPGPELAVEYEAEERLAGPEGSADGEDQHTARLRARLPEIWGGWRAAVLAQVRWDRRWAAGEAPEPDGRRRLYQIDLGYTRAATSAELQFARRTTDQTTTGGERQSDLVDWALSHRPPRGIVQGEWRGRVTTAAERQRVGQLLEVDSGTGHYDSLGTYVGQGDYDFYYVRADSTLLETQLESAARGTLRPFARAGGGESVLRGLEATLYGRLEVATADRLAHLLEDARRLWLGEGNARRHLRLVRSELSWSGGSRWPAPRVGFEQRVRRERTLGGLGRTARQWSGDGEIRWSPRRGITTRGRLELSRQREGITRDDGGEAYADELRLRAVSAEISWRFYAPLTVRLSAAAQQEQYLPAERRRSLTSLESAWVLEPGRATRLEIAARRRWSGGDGVENLPFLIQRPGWRLTATASVRPRSGITGSARLQVSQDEGRSTVTTGRMEVRAYF
ncbi:MAG: hypothetical protein GF330_13475 [Candidatus Eisenbacteria bacterium]|nr:hypothetical protein [Candidatus Eisenbacteria bacterium]